MFGSIKLGKFFGIDTHIHGTFWLLPLLVLFTSFGAGLVEITFRLLFVFAVFLCVALHEVGHALAAAAYGIRTRDITLYPIGGVARLDRMPEKPLREIAVALAGPAVNVVIALGLLVGIVASGVSPALFTTAFSVEAFFVDLLVVNVLLGLFNLLPAFPMDGGRVLRALLAIRMTRVRATEVAVKVGTVVAVLMLVAGVVDRHVGLIAVAVVVWLLGQAELAAVRMAGAAREFEVRAREMFGGAPVPGPAPRTLPVDTAADLADRRFSGLAWDADRRIWVRWANGVPVAYVPM